MKLKVSEVLLKTRNQRNMSQHEIAELLDMSVSAYGRLERGETSLEINQLVKISEKLNIPIQEFLPDTITFHNHNTGPIGVNFGTYTVYQTNEEFIQQVLDENKKLHQRLNQIEEILRILLEKLS